jgi:hypothetical protein
MKQPDGTSIEEICRELHINRRSVFRLLKTIERTFHIPVTVHRESFGGTASYHLPTELIDLFSNISFPAEPLTFTQALCIYLIFNDDTFPKGGAVSNEIVQLQKRLETLYAL